MGAPTAMAEKQLHLFQLVSPALPVGGFSYSEGLEWLVQHGRLHDAATVRSWLEAELRLPWRSFPNSYGVELRNRG